MKPSWGQPEVDEARPRNLEPFDMWNVRLLEFGQQFLTQLAGVLLRDLGTDQRGVRAPIAVIEVGRPLDRDRGRYRVNTQGRKRLMHSVDDRGANHR